MDKQSQWDKLFKMSPDPPTEFPKTQCLNRPITYREACIDYVKKTMRCVGYRDYLVTELEKLDRIEQAIKKVNCYYPLDTISEIENILKQDN